MRNLLFGLAAVAAALPASASAADCQYRIVIYGMASSNTSSQRIDSSTVEHTTTSRIGTTASAGTLTLRTDGSYEIRGYINVKGTKTGRWIDNDEGPFSDKGGIELLEVKGPEYGPNDRSWFVYTNDEGELVAREPPYTAYETLALKNAGGAECAPGKTAAAAAPPPAKADETAGLAQAAASPAQPASASPARARQWTMQEFREHFMGLTREQVIAELGQPNDTGYKQLVFHRLTLRDADDPSSTAHSASISFTEQEGGEVWHIGFAN